VHAYSKDGAMRVVSVSGPVYAPNSKGGPRSDTGRCRPDYWGADGGLLRSACTLREQDDDS
jgi:catalase